MKVCIPTMGNRGLDEIISAHFGYAETFTIVDTETNEIKVVHNTSEHKGGIGLPPEIIAENGAHIMLAGGLGPRAVQMFEQYGVDVFVGATGTVKNAVDDWKNGYLEEATDENVCNEHRH
ncbi:MAG: NifB/NifX family molybdenum-iron cluster-binding protein [Methanotrichaceae archaeon]